MLTSLEISVIQRIDIFVMSYESCISSHSLDNFNTFLGCYIPKFLRIVPLTSVSFLPQGALCSSVEEIQTQNFYIYNIS